VARADLSAAPTGADDARVVRLGDGRALAYAEQGDPAGTPVLFFHGLPGSRLTRHPDGSIAARLGIRLLTFDRPGIGLSTPKRRRHILDWPRDVAEFADAAGLERFAVAGWSGGGPYALATAHELADRVTAVGLVCSVTPLADRSFLHHLGPVLQRRARIGRWFPLAVRRVARRNARAFAEDAEAALDREYVNLPACDRRILDDPALRAMQVATRREAYRQGAGGVYAEGLLYLKPWGFELESVRAPVRLWHGEADETLTAEMGRHLAAVLPDCEATFVPGEGHMLCLTHWADILRTFA
jgi:pimeloyl-ACP methyl ester carboxylesterase